MVAAVSATPNPKASANRSNLPGRRPLLPSETDNGVVAAPWRPKSREVTSRYLSSSTSTSSGSSSSSSSSFSSSSTSRRCASPLARTSSTSGVMTPMPNSSSVKRSQSVERRRPATPRPNGGEMSNATKMLFNSTRSLSVSFQGESFAVPVSKAKPSAAASTPNLSNVRKGTPERRKAMTPLRNGADQTENSKPIEQHRWPPRSRQVNSLTKSLDMTVERKKLNGSGSIVRALQQSMIDEKSRGSNSINPAVQKPASVVLVDAKSVKGSVARSDNVVQDTESVSSCSVSGGHECVTDSLVQARGGVRGIVVPARFWQETNNRLRRVSEPGSPQKGSMSKTMAPPLKQILPRSAVLDGPNSSPRGISSNRGFVSPLRVASRPASPSMLATPNVSSPSHGMSPSRGRNAVASVSSTPSILSFGADVRRGRLGEDVHLLRILHNSYLQWRFINAKSDATLRAQKLTSEV
ncbi:QWRF family [Dillenia turbinata]|uniref:QWRF family n=1 Tax=Dillenia turbinata TaxID=194707 RepID=A0AAN8W3W4_9MAGN